MKMDELPNEILPMAAGFLDPVDAIHLNSTCKKLHSKLSLSATCPRRIINNFSRYNCDDDVHYGFPIPVPDQILCHSILLSMTWRDQGWGNRKGRVFVVEQEGERPATSEPFGGGLIVYASGIGQHEDQRLDITLQPRQKRKYHLWYAVGEGGGHSLHLSYVNIQNLIFDNGSHCFGKAYNFLTRMGSLQAWDQELGRRDSVDAENIELFLQTGGDHLIPPLISFDNVNDISEADLQMKLRGYITCLQNMWIEEYFAYAKIVEDASLQPGFRETGFHDFFGDMQDDDFLEDRMDFGDFVVPEE
mmetsp:Transcript_27830/g.47311  ORF Transcript_27830/g.47311 Transcript_27830/m.47311 type:complete len:303 (+) Transcript_27830:3-911(+)